MRSLQLLLAASVLGGCSIVLSNPTASSYFSVPVVQPSVSPPALVSPNASSDAQAAAGGQSGEASPSVVPTSAPVRLAQIAAFEPLPPLYVSRIRAVAGAGNRVAVVHGPKEVAVSADGGQTFMPTTFPDLGSLDNTCNLVSDGRAIFAAGVLVGGQRVLRLSGADWVADSDLLAGSSGIIRIAGDGVSVVAMTQDAVFRRTAEEWGAPITALFPKDIHRAPMVDLDGDRLYALGVADDYLWGLYRIDLSASNPAWSQVGDLFDTRQDSPLKSPGSLAVADGFAYMVAEPRFLVMDLGSLSPTWQVDPYGSYEFEPEWVGKVGGNVYRSVIRNLERKSPPYWAAAGRLKVKPTGAAVAAGKLFVGTAHGLWQKALSADWLAAFEPVAPEAFRADLWLGTNGGTLYARSFDFPWVRTTNSQGGSWGNLELGAAPVGTFLSTGGTMFVSDRDSDYRNAWIGRGGEWLPIAPKQYDPAAGSWFKFAGVTGERAFVAEGGPQGTGIVTVSMHDLSRAGGWSQAAPSLDFDYVGHIGEIAVAGGEVFVGKSRFGDSNVMVCQAPGEGATWTEVDAPEPESELGYVHLAAVGDVPFLVVSEYGRASRIYRFDRGTRTFVPTGEGFDLMTYSMYSPPVTDGTDLYLVGMTAEAVGPPYTWAIRRIPLSGGPAEAFGPAFPSDGVSLAFDRVGRRLYVGTSEGALVGR